MAFERMYGFRASVSLLSKYITFERIQLVISPSENGESTYFNKTAAEHLLRGGSIVVIIWI